jgi:hypothetical protein
VVEIASTGGKTARGVVPHPARTKAVKPATNMPWFSNCSALESAFRARKIMLVIVLEALGALALLLFFVWWTMFSGRRRGERSNESLDAPGGELDEAGRTRD